MKSKLLTPKNLYYLISFVILIPLLIYQGKRSNKAICEESKTDLYNRNFKGIIVEKFIDSLNHRAKTLRIKTSSDTINEWLFGVNSMNDLYRDIDKGDSLTKLEGTNLYIRKTENELTEYTASLDCEN